MFIENWYVADTTWLLIYIYTKHFHEKKLQKTTFQVAIESHAPLSRDLKRKQKKTFSFLFICIHSETFQKVISSNKSTFTFFL